MDQSAKAAGTAGFGAQCPCENASDSKTSAMLLARDSARRTLMSLNGGFASLKPVAPLVNHVYSAVCSPGLRWRAMGASSQRTACWYSGPKSLLPLSHVASREAGALSLSHSALSA